MHRFLFLLLFLSPRLGIAQAPSAADEQTPAEVKPQGAPPTEAPPPLPDKPPAPPKAAAEPTPTTTPPAETGQWVYTGQYGWVWVLYGDEYVYTPPDESGEPYAYLYYPTYGWMWVAAPWVWGVGPLPYFGVAGAWRFHWYRGPAYHP